MGYTLLHYLLLQFVLHRSVPGGLGIIRGSTLGFEIKALNSVESGTENGAANGVDYLEERSQSEVRQQELDCTSLRFGPI